MTKPTRPSLLIGLAALALAGLAQAQGVYRIVGPDGKVTFSDKPPTAAQAAAGATTNPAASGGSTSDTNLPYELRQVVSRYPVTLYTSAQCAPCDAARSLLKQRGVPFNEKTVSTQEDTEALQRLAGEPTLPVGTIGAQKLKGFSDSEWAQYLDAAGYPKASQLPKAYRYPAASPLVAVQKPAPAKPAEANKPAPEATPRALPSAPGPSNPAGIVF
jgi:glutaredoxin